ncbi:hypothetical protein JOB18_013098 [Solea senegalensis]|nr:hypothetical protein JOB18_013098 [Solea senegalensis]
MLLNSCSEEGGRYTPQQRLTKRSLTKCEGVKEKMEAIQISTHCGKSQCFLKVSMDTSPTCITGWKRKKERTIQPQCLIQVYAYDGTAATPWSLWTSYAV